MIWLVGILIFLIGFCCYQAKDNQKRERILYLSAVYFTYCAKGNTQEAAMAVTVKYLKGEKEYKEFCSTCVTIEQEVNKQLMAEQLVNTVWPA